MNNMQYSEKRLLERIPTKFVLSKSFREDGSNHSDTPFYKALNACGIGNCNIVSYISILPAHCEEVDQMPQMQTGALLSTILARCDGAKGDQITAGLIVGELIQKSNGRKGGSLVCKASLRGTKQAVTKQLKEAINALYKERHSEKYELENIRVEVESCWVKKKRGSVVVSMALLEHEQVFAPALAKNKPFIGQQAPYNKAKYAVLPILYDGTATHNRGSAEAPLSILNASTYLENYDIETDSQPHKVGFHTLNSIRLEDDPIEMIETVRDEMKKLILDKKFPVLLGGGHGISIGAFHALKELKTEFTILQLDAHTNLRNSFDGTPYSEACTMSRGLDCTDKIVQVGVRSISNRERTTIDYDKLFLSADISGDKGMWIDDVIEECGENVYITLDVDVFDPSIMHSGTPEPAGLNYKQVLNLLKKVIKERNVIGLDVNNLVTVPGMNGPEVTVAKLIFQFIANLEKFGSKNDLKSTKSLTSKQI